MQASTILDLLTGSRAPKGCQVGDMPILCHVAYFSVTYRNMPAGASTP
jgi:hypothetical protein